jgi:hypothetical protein
MHDLGEAAGAYCRFITDAHTHPERNISQALAEAGWSACKPEARIAYLFYVGALMSGTFFRGVRAATPEGGERIPEVEELLESAEECLYRMAMPPWSRWLYRVTRWLRRRKASP